MFIPLDDNVSPKACAEELGYTFLPCVLANLHKAPNLVDLSDRRVISKYGHTLITSEDIDAIVAPVRSSPPTSAAVLYNELLCR